MNRLGVGKHFGHGDRYSVTLMPREGLSRMDVINLIAWLAALAEITPQEVAQEIATSVQVIPPGWAEVNR